MADDGASNEDGSILSFQSLAAEGDILAKQGEFKKAIEAYTKALLQRPTDKNVLVSRSKCHLQIGDCASALHDADASLAEDKEFFKGKFQKAEALYAKGDFEMALVYYHRGHTLRPELDEFRLGIQKCREAIDNSIGNPREIKLRHHTTAAASPSSLDSKSLAPPTNSSGVKSAATGSNKVESSVGPSSSKKAASEESSAFSVKQLLGEIYEDKEYLEQFLNDKDFINCPNEEIRTLVTEGLRYLDTRIEFWRQQKPLYARRSRITDNRAKSPNTRTNAGGIGVGNKGEEIHLPPITAN